MTSRVCCSGGDWEGLYSSEVVIWLEAESPCLIR